MSDSYLKEPHFLLVFLDGLGLGAAIGDNPLATAASMPFLTDFVEQPLLSGATLTRTNVLLKPIDATLGVSGLPQSATGQTTLYTGQNAPRFLGRHQSGFANGALRSLLNAQGLFARAIALGSTATLANAYSPAYFYAIAQRKRRYSVCTLLNLIAKLPFRMQYEYEQGEAIFWNIVGNEGRNRSPALNSHRLSQSGGRSPLSPEMAGQRLAKLSQHYGVTLFESYLTDYAGHAQNADQAIAYLQRIDTFLASAIAHLPSTVTLIVTSDHGNVEDLSTKRHTFNAVPLLVIGPAAKAFVQVTDLTGITPQILARLAPVSGPLSC
ncbi:MAG: alkaline phosphatase family protein [Phormidesmis sp.]